ncbi:hypothetical protein [Ramlibacter rhizophilus]|uniref:hypothetical protein n=1 Tax=Ramlibacter rhizophilus TaxID=1781167 RepID=UPI001432761C|nr:hypothetical protein [Ramlibacter rhizophilus]
MRLPAPTHPLHLVAGQAAWLAWFGLVYAGQAVGCAAWPPAPGQGPFTAINAVLLLVTLGTAAALAWAAWASWRSANDPLAGGQSAQDARFIGRASAWLYAVSSAGTLFVGTPLVMLPPCL